MQAQLRDRLHRQRDRRRRVGSPARRQCHLHLHDDRRGREQRDGQRRIGPACDRVGVGGQRRLGGGVGDDAGGEEQDDDG